MPNETHPLQPFLPPHARMLLLGSFPPPKRRWSMDFFYPNWTNDMWRIWSFLLTGQTDYFVQADGQKRFDQERIELFCQEQGIALYDSAEEIVRLRGNASDSQLQVVRPTDVWALLSKLPDCQAVVATGQKSAEMLQGAFSLEAIGVGQWKAIEVAGRNIKVWRMPSTSRAFPRPIAWKAEYYGWLLADVGGWRPGPTAGR